MIAKVTKQPVDNSDEIEMLRAKLALLENKSDDEVDAKIEQDEYIQVMSLLPYPLNLSTKEMGQGSIKKFTKFGEIKRIMYKDLVDILEVHANFLEAGYFYILNPALIRHHGLNDVYSKILTKDKIEEILLANSEECVSLYNSANEKQQEIIIQLLIEKVRNNSEGVNLNMVDRLSRASKVDIMKKAIEGKETSEALLDEN
jgi:hypothetical protein